MIGTQRTDEWGRTIQSGNQTGDLSAEGKVRDRLAKILALTKSPNEREAGIAAAKLQEMLTEYNLSVADLEQRGQKSPGMRQESHDLGKAAFKWKLDLAEGIAEHYYCAPLVDRTRKTVAFVGRPDNVESLQMLYAWIIDQIKDIAREERRKHFDTTGEHIDPLRWQVSFGEGAVIRLIERLKELKARQMEDMTRDSMGDVTALVQYRQTEVSDYLEEHHGYRVDGKKTKAERESDERWEKYMAERAEAAAAKDTMRIQCEAAGDMEPYYKEYPEEHPDAVAKRQKQLDRWRREEEKREARNSRRRTGSWRSGPTIDHEKEAQSRTARKAGKEAAGRVNLQPFLAGSTDRKKVGG